MTKGHRMNRRKEPQSDAALPPELPEPPVPGSTDAPFVQPVAEKPAVQDPPPVSDNVSSAAAAPPRGGVFAPLLGGALAAVAGFALSHFNILGLSATDSATELAQLGSRIDALAAEQTAAIDKVTQAISAADSRIVALESKPAPDAPDLSRLDGLEQRLAAIESVPTDGTASNTALAAKIAELDRRLTTLPATQPSADLQKQLDDALARLDSAESAATAKAAEAEAAASAAKRSQALEVLAAAVGGGQPFAAELQALADPDLDAALKPLSETGVPTLATLQAEFPDPARESLRLARDSSGNGGWTDRLVNFLASQTGARPVTPQEGDTPDAILSRAEFALSEGRVQDALTELDTLDPAIRAPLDGWIAQAKSHVAAAAALQAARGK